jgi:hypothetical protein
MHIRSTISGERKNEHERYWNLFPCVHRHGEHCLYQSRGRAVWSAYGLILSEADKNKDGKLSVSECKAVYKDPAMAEKNCKFWDADSDGIITEDEYVRQGMSFGKKK